MNFKPIPNKFEDLPWTEVENIAKDKRSTIIWPFGAIEQHGPHLPLATDSVFVDEIINEVFTLFPSDIPFPHLKNNIQEKLDFILENFHKKNHEAVVYSMGS